MRHIVLGFLALLAAAAPAAAVTVRDCNDDEATASARNIVEPWERNTRTFYNGRVRAALLDTGGEPACCSLHLLVISPSTEAENGYQFCHLVSDHDNFGFGEIDFAKLAAAYDAKRGLKITFPFNISDGNGGTPAPGFAKLWLNLAKGTLTVEK